MTKLIAIGFLAALASCGDNSRDVSQLREAIAGSRVTLHDMIAVAEGSMADGHAITAELVVGGTPVYSYGTVGAGTLHDVRVDTIEGAVVATLAAGAGNPSCPGSLSLAEAIVIAEAQVAGGTVIAAIPDDDVACARELQVLDPTLLWEVKVGGAGEVLELEESDETED